MCNRREGEGHRDPVNTNTTSGRGGQTRNKNQDCINFILKDVELLHLQFAKNKFVFPKTSNNLVFHFDGVAESLCQQSVEKPNEFFFLCVDRRVVSGTRVGRRRINRIRVATVWRRRGSSDCQDHSLLSHAAAAIIYILLTFISFGVNVYRSAYCVVKLQHKTT